MIEIVSAELVATLVAVTLAVIILIYRRPSLIRTRGGKALAFVAFFILPIVCICHGFRLHFEATKTTSFCLSCHVMEPYGESLLRTRTTCRPRTFRTGGWTESTRASRATPSTRCSAM